MVLTFSYCKNGDYSNDNFEAKLEKRLLFHPNRGKLEVSLCLQPEISGLSDGKFNVMFEDKNSEINIENDKKYFAYITQWQKQKLLWMYQKHWFQKSENIWKIVTPLVTFWSGYFLHLITHKCP